MKRCPQCNRIEADEALKFCRVDGTTLVSDSSLTGTEAGTAQLGYPAGASEVRTSILSPNTQFNSATATTTVLPAQPAASTTSEPSKPKRKTTIIVAVILTAVVAATSAVLVDSYRSRKSGGAAIQSI